LCSVAASCWSFLPAETPIVSSGGLGLDDGEGVEIARWVLMSFDGHQILRRMEADIAVTIRHARITCIDADSLLTARASVARFEIGGPREELTLSRMLRETSPARRRSFPIDRRSRASSFA
jgi:hypothetical protein